MPQPRFRIFCGPNGSGKTTFYESLRNSNIINTEIYINADKIESRLLLKKQFNFNAYRVKVDEQEFKEHITKSGLFHTKINDPHFIQEFTIKQGILRLNAKKINSYHASFIATYLTEKLFASNQSFCFETVLSHPDKIKYFKLAEKLGYKTYLYFLFTNNPTLNIKRIVERVKQGKHNVPSNLVIERFTRSLNILKQMINIPNSIYLIDNSEQFPKIIFERIGKKILINKTKDNFIATYL